MALERIVLIAEHANGGLRLDQFLARAAPAAGHELSRRAARRLIELGSVHVDRKRVRVASRKVRAGSRVEVYLGEPTAPVGELLQVPVVLFEDAHLLALDKPSGLLSQASRDDAVHHLLATAERWLASKGGQAVRPRLLHRLDRGTSGVSLLAKTRRAAAAMSEAFTRREIEKTYRALCALPPKDPTEIWAVGGRLDRQSRGGRVKVVPVTDGGQEAETRFRWLGRGAGHGVVEAMPVTGRTHQIRVHLAMCDMPVLGDWLYGGPAAARLMLHAEKLCFEHPISGEELMIESPLPADWSVEEQDE